MQSSCSYIGQIIFIKLFAMHCVVPHFWVFCGRNSPLRWCSAMLMLLWLITMTWFFHLLLVSTDVSAASRIKAAHSFLTASTSLVVVFMGDLALKCSGRELIFHLWVRWSSVFTTVRLILWLLVLVGAWLAGREASGSACFNGNLCLCQLQMTVEPQP